MPARRLALVVSACLVLTAGCSSSGGKQATSSGARASTSASASPSGGSTPAAALATKMRAGLATLTSAHIVVDAGSLGGTSSGDFRYADGRSTASDITVNSGADKTRIVTIGSTSYAELPAGRNTSGKPWVKVSATSKNEFVRALSSELDLSKAAASLPAVADITATASSLRDRGAATVGGVSAHHYALVINPANSTGTTLGTLLGDIGQKSVPVDLYLDARARPVSVRISVKIGLSSFEFMVDAGSFDAPVKITAPPRSQVSTTG